MSRRVVFMALTACVACTSSPSASTARTPAPSVHTGVRSVLVVHGPRSVNGVALTFDADLTPAMERRLDSGTVASYADVRTIDELRAAHAPATIFVTGLWGRRYPDLLRSLGRDPLFEIENHSWSHPAFETPCYSLAAVTDKRAEVVRTEAELTQVTGRAPRYFRFPGGCASAADVRLVASLGLVSVGWDVVSGDAYLTEPRAVVANVLGSATGGSIIVLHLDGAPRTPATAGAVPGIVGGLRARGFRLVRLDQLLPQ